MSKRASAILLMLTLLWRSVAGLPSGGLAEQGDEIAHAIAHAQAIDHYHHDDQSLHLDDTIAEPTHQHADEGGQLAGLLPAGGARLVLTDLESPEGMTVGRPPPGFRDEPLRPPCGAA